MSDAPMQKSRNAQSDVRSAAGRNWSDPTRQSQEAEKRSSQQSQKSSGAIESTKQSDRTTSQARQRDANTRAESSVAKAPSDKENAVQSVDRKNSSKKATSTRQDSSTFQLQDSTVQAGPTGVLTASTTTTATDGSAGAADSTGQSQDAQAVSGVDDQGASAQPPAGAQTLPVTREGNAEFAASVLQVARDAGEPNALELAATDSAKAGSATETQDPVAANSVNSAGVAGVAQVAEASAALQSNIAQRGGARMAVKPGMNDANQLSVQQTQSKIAGLAASLKDTSKPDKDTDSGDGSSSSQNFGNALSDLQAAQSSTAHTPSAGGDANALQAVMAAAPSASHGATAAQSSQGSGETAALRSDAAADPANRLAGNDSAGMSGISTARLIQNMSGTEMRVGMHSHEFGDISIRTSVSQKQMQTQISVDHNELGSALSAHIPSLQAKLGSDYGLHSTIEVNQGGASFTNNGHSQNQQQQTSVRSVESVEMPTTSESDIVGLSGVIQSSGDSRLDIRA